MAEVPLHRLNTPQTLLWNFGGNVRRKMANHLSKRYPTGVGVLNRSQDLVAFVAPNGNIRELKPPFTRYEMWQIANRPRPLQCPCAEFFDPEIQGPWRDRGLEGEHHPFCQFDRTAQLAYTKTLREAQAGASKMRPDAWYRSRQFVRGERGEKSRGGK